jgi:hypothetical protein
LVNPDDGGTTSANSFTSIGGGTSTGFPATYVGLPVVGFAVQSFANGAIHVGTDVVLSNYGGNFVHKGTRRIEFPLL